MTFDSGFAPDYVMWVTRGFNSNTNEFEVFANFSELNTNGGGFGAFLGRLASPAPNQTVSGTFGGSNGAPLVEFGYNDSNTAGVVGDVGGVPGTPADQTAAAAVTTGTELSIDLPQIGATDDFRMMIGVNGSNHDFWSNQFLPGLTPVDDPPRQGNLGGDGLGNFVEPGGAGTGGTVGMVNFNTIVGDQFLTIDYAAPLSEWNFAGNGAWSEAGKWTADVPDARDARAVLGTLAGEAPRTISVDIPVELQQLTLTSTGGYTLSSGGGTLTIAGNPATPSLVVNTGNQQRPALELQQLRRHRLGHRRGTKLRHVGRPRRAYQLGGTDESVGQHHAGRSYRRRVPQRAAARL
jgi:hypothetical protein